MRRLKFIQCLSAAFSLRHQAGSAYDDEIDEQVEELDDGEQDLEDDQMDDSDGGFASCVSDSTTAASRYR